MYSRLRSTLGCLLFTGLVTATALATGSNPMSRLDYLTGSFNCSSTTDKPYVESFSRPFGVSWLRATDTTNGAFSGEHTLGFDSQTKTLTIVSTYPSGMVSVDRGTSIGNGPLTTVYPSEMSGKLTFTRLSNTSYTVEGRGTYKGKAYHFLDKCSK
jgi:hypothetical protein